MISFATFDGGRPQWFAAGLANYVTAFTDFRFMPTLQNVGTFLLLSLPFGVYLAYLFYATSLPKDLLAAARVDGCNEWNLFRYIALPLSRTLLGLLTFLSFTANWNNYFLPYVMLNNDELLNLPVGLQVLMSGTSALRPTFATDLPIHRAEVALAGLLLVVPVALVFLFAQHFVISGALTGATKE